MGNQQSIGAATSAPAHINHPTVPAMPPAEPAATATAAAAVKPAAGARPAKRKASEDAAAAIAAQAAGTTLREQQAAANAAAAAPEPLARPQKRAKPAAVAAAAAGDATVRDQQQQQGEEEEDQPKKSKREAAAEARGDDAPGITEPAGQPDTSAARGKKKQKSQQAAAAADPPAAQKDKAAAAKTAKQHQAPAAATAGAKGPSAAAKAKRPRAPKPTGAGTKQGSAAARAAGSKKAAQQQGDNAPQQQQQQQEQGDSSKQAAPKPAATKRKGRHEKPAYEPAVELEKAYFAAMAAAVADPVAVGAASLAAQPVLMARDKKRPLWQEDAENIKLVTTEKEAKDYLKKSAVSFEAGEEPYRKFVLPASLMQLAEAVATAAQQYGTRSKAYKDALAAYEKAAAADPKPSNGRQKGKEYPKDSAAGATAAVAAEAAAAAGVAEGIRLEREVLVVAHEAYGDEEGRLAQAVKRVDDDYWAKHRRANATEELRFRLSQQAMKIAEEKLKEREGVAAAAASGASVPEDEDAPAEDLTADDSQLLAQLVERAMKGELKTASRRPDRVAESRSLAEGHVIHETAAFGHLAGLPVNYRFMGRSQALVLGMQPSPMAGICSKTTPTTITVNGQAHKGVVVATSVVSSGIYQADTDASDGLVMYTGAGENDLNGNKMQTGDQKLNGANRSLVAALAVGMPIRLSRRNDDDSSSSVYGTCLYYDGLYRVVGVCKRVLPPEPGRNKACTVFVFGLKRIEGQPASLSKPIPHFLANKAAKVSKGDEKVRADCLATDLSKGVEAVKVPVVNEIDSTLPPGINPADPEDAKFLLKHAKDTELQADKLPLKYIKEDVYDDDIVLPTAPKLLLKDARDPQEAAAAREAEQQIRQAVAAGDGSGSSTCGVLYNREVVVATKQQAANPHNLLKLLNGGMLPYTFDKKGVPVTCDTLRVLHECADWMGCNNENCPQRQLKHGLRFKLEVFKTPNRGWGVQSWEAIPAGALVAVMRGVVMNAEDLDAYLSKGNSEYLFDLLPRGDFTDDGKRLPEGETVERKLKYVLCARDKGGVARFINHSCDPNLYVQPICSGHTNTDMVAIGLCAARNIPPCVELTYDYGCKFVKDNLGGACMCGAVNCVSKRHAQQAGAEAAAAGAVVFEEDS